MIHGEMADAVGNFEHERKNILVHVRHDIIRQRFLEADFNAALLPEGKNFFYQLFFLRRGNQGPLDFTPVEIFDIAFQPAGLVLRKQGSAL